MRIAIFGTVGAGKTTLIENLLLLLPKGYEVYLEPLTENPYFQELYTDKNTNDTQYKMELWMLASRMKQLTDSKDQQTVLFDRGVPDTLIFADANHQLGNIDDRDYKVYEDYFNSCVIPTIFNDEVRLYDLMIYLKVNDETSINHIKTRGLPAEQSVDINFWKMVNQKYDYWYEQWKNQVPFYIIDGNNDDSKSLALKIVTDLNLKFSDI